MTPQAERRAYAAGPGTLTLTLSPRREREPDTAYPSM